MAEVTKKNVEDLVISVLTYHGVPADQAKTISDSILYAHEREKHTHGIGRVPIYVRKIKEGLMNAKTKKTFKTDAPVIAVLDGGNGFGQVSGKYAMEEAIARAKKFGIGMIGVSDSNNFGTAGFLAEMAAKEGMIGMVMGNSAPAIAPTGGRTPLFGTNPLCYSFPRGKRQGPITLDMACSIAARGKIRLADKNGEKIPFGWAVDENGEPTDDPARALKGSLLPVGGAKGYGLSLAVDIIAGLLTGSAFGGDVKPLNHPNEPSRYGHMFIAVNIEHFLEQGSYEEQIEELVRRIKSCGKAGEVLLPGEASFQKSQKWTKTVALPNKQFDEINRLAEELGLSTVLREI